MTDGDSGALWIFGYGSLIWHPGFPFVERRVATALGYARRFYQGSPDHRGVPDAPGRVVTLVPMRSESCGGVAYRVAAADRAAVLSQLDRREQGGYSRVELTIHFAAGGEQIAITYLGAADNPHYLGRATPAEIGAVARKSQGPSGTNRDYVLQLVAALRELNIDDPHVVAVAAALSEPTDLPGRSAAQ